MLRLQYGLLLLGVGLGTVASGEDAQQRAPDTKRVLLLAQGPDGHPPQTHEYVAGMRVLVACLTNVPGLEVEVVRADGPWLEGPDLIRGADGVVLFLAQGAKWIHEDPRRLESFAQLAARRGGFVALHWGMGTREERYVGGFLKLFGGCYGGPDRKYKVLTADVVRAQEAHEILNGIGDFTARDEFYYRLRFVAAEPTVKPILRATIDGQTETVAWAWQRSDGGRSFGFSGGHFHENWRHQEYRRLMAQAILWSVRLPVPAQGLPVEVSEEVLKVTPGRQ